MNRTIIFILLVLTLVMSACTSISPNPAQPAPGTQGGPAAGELSAPTQLALGTIKLDETKNAVTAEQAGELLPLWQTLQVLYGSDTAADQEIEALTAQIQETMTTEQTQAITALNLTRQDMIGIMQTEGIRPGGAQNGNTSGTSNNGGGFVRPGGGDFAGGPPPDGAGFPGGGPNFQGQGNRPASSDSAAGNSQPAAIDPNRIPTPLIQAVIDYLKNKDSKS